VHTFVGNDNTKNKSTIIITKNKIKKMKLFKKIIIILKIIIRVFDTHKSPKP